MTFPVYVVDDDVHGLRCRSAKTFFAPEDFQVYQDNSDPRPLSNCGEKLSARQRLEYYRFHHCLLAAERQHPQQHCLVVKNTSVSLLSSRRLADLISSCTQEDYDLLYLCRWRDKCHVSFGKKWLAKHQVTIAETYSPHGCQAVVISPRGRRQILERLQGAPLVCSLEMELRKGIEGGRFRAQAVTPNVINYDLSLISDNRDYVKFQLCTAAPKISGSKKVSSSLLPSVGILLLLILAVVAWYSLYRAARGSDRERRRTW